MRALTSANPSGAGFAELRTREPPRTKGPLLRFGEGNIRRMRTWRPDKLAVIRSRTWRACQEDAVRADGLASQADAGDTGASCSTALWHEAPEFLSVCTRTNQFSPRLERQTRRPVLATVCSQARVPAPRAPEPSPHRVSVPVPTRCRRPRSAQIRRPGPRAAGCSRARVPAPGAPEPSAHTVSVPVPTRCRHPQSSRTLRVNPNRRTLPPIQDASS